MTIFTPADDSPNPPLCGKLVIYPRETDAPYGATYRINFSLRSVRMEKSTQYMSTLLLMALIAMFPLLWSCGNVYEDVESNYTYDYPAESDEDTNVVPAEAYYPHHEPVFQHTVTPSANDMPYGG